MATLTQKQIDSLIDRDRSWFIERYKKIVETPSVSNLPERKGDIVATARMAVSFLKEAGAKVAEIIETKGYPVVFGRFENKPGAPTVAIYNHLDVQPANKEKDGWLREPFRFSEEKGRFYSRGTTDDKGPAMTAFWAAKLARELKLPVNIEFIWELEEEIGSPNFSDFLTAAKKMIQADSILVSDTLWLSSDTPAVTRGLRGLLAVLIRLRTGGKDVHSGVTGGAARNPIAELCEVVAKCMNARTGEITIPGFDKTWKKPTRDEVKEYARSGFDVAKFKKTFELHSMRVSSVEDVVERIWLSPTLEVHGLAGGYQDAGIKTIVPPFGELKLSFRLVPGQDPEKVFDVLSAHVRKINPDCEVHREGTLLPYACPDGRKETQFVRDAYEFGFGKSPVSVREGGSIGAIVKMDQALKVPILFMGLSRPEDGYHEPNESFSWDQVQGGVKAFLRYFERLSEA